jgi:hypothetical protein
MTDRDKLPAKTPSGHLVLPKDQPGSLVTRGLDALKKKPETDPAKLFRDAVVSLDNDDFWVKVVEFLQQNWAVIERQAAGGVRVHFVGDTSGVFDEISFPSAEQAADALRRNGFSRHANSLDLQSFLRPPSAPFHRRPHPNGPIYSSGRFWKK